MPSSVSFCLIAAVSSSLFKLSHLLYWHVENVQMYLYLYLWSASVLCVEKKRRNMIRICSLWPGKPEKTCKGHAVKCKGMLVYFVSHGDGRTQISYNFKEHALYSLHHTETLYSAYNILFDIYKTAIILTHHVQNIYNNSVWSLYQSSHNWDKIHKHCTQVLYSTFLYFSYMWTSAVSLDCESVFQPLKGHFDFISGRLSLWSLWGDLVCNFENFVWHSPFSAAVSVEHLKQCEHILVFNRSLSLWCIMRCTFWEVTLIFSNVFHLLNSL